MNPISKRRRDIVKVLELRRSTQVRVISGQLQNDTKWKNAETEFIPVTISSPVSRDPEEIVKEDQRIEIHLPDGIRIILTGSESLRSAKQILNTV